MLSEPGTWPSVTYETLPRTSDPAAGTASRSQARQHRGPYRAAVPAPIRDLDLQLPSDLLAAAEDAATEIARFDSLMGAEIAPFAAVLLRSESAASSRIENLTASARAIAEAEIGVGARPDASEIVANSRAMSAAVALADRLDADAVLTMHRVLMEADHPDIAGRWRSQPVWIGGSHVGPHEAMFVPPQHDRVPAAVDDLIAFADRDDLPLLPHIAVTHAQFETIHPFPDGNGRTGRALLHAMLRAKGLTRSVTVPISAGLLTDTDRYFSALDAYREGDPGPIVDRIATATFQALDNGRALVTELHETGSRWRDAVKARSDSATWRIADLLVRQPVVNAATLTDQLGILTPNVYRSLEPLIAAGVLVEFTDRSRNRAWRADEVLKALDRFAARAGRRG